MTVKKLLKHSRQRAAIIHFGSYINIWSDVTCILRFDLKSTAFCEKTKCAWFQAILAVLLSFRTLFQAKRVQETPRQQIINGREMVYNR